MNKLRYENSIYFDNLNGYVFYTDETQKGEECVIYDLYVVKEYRNQGIGTFLIKGALKEIFKAGYKKAFVVVKDKKLIPFYEKLGFIKTSENEMYFYKESL